MLSSISRQLLALASLGKGLADTTRLDQLCVALLLNERHREGKKLASQTNWPTPYVWRTFPAKPALIDWGAGRPFQLRTWPLAIQIKGPIRAARIFITADRIKTARRKHTCRNHRPQVIRATRSFRYTVQHSRSRLHLSRKMKTSWVYVWAASAKKELKRGMISTPLASCHFLPRAGPAVTVSRFSCTYAALMILILQRQHRSRMRRITH